jgi:hypothetical protein
MGGCK